MESTDAEAGMPSAEASGAICVQKLDDSRNSAIHIKYRISLRSSSLREPRYPLLRVVSRLWAHPRSEPGPPVFSILRYVVVVGVLASGRTRHTAAKPCGTPLVSDEAKVPPHKTFSPVFAGSTVPA